MTVAGAGAVLGGIGAVGSAIGGLFGGGGSAKRAAEQQARAQIRSAEIQAQSAREARDQIERWYQLSRGDLGPYNVTGRAANERLGGLFNVPGHEQLDPTETLRATPGYEWLQGQGTEALQRYGAASGMRNSGAALRGATDYGQNLALTKAWTPYISGLQNLSESGRLAGTALAGFGSQAGQSMAGLTQAEGQALGTGQVNAANALSAGQMMGGSTTNNIMRSLGMIGGLATNPNIQSLGQSIGNWFGSGSGGNFSGASASANAFPTGIINPYAYTRPGNYTAALGQQFMSMPRYALGGPVPQGGRPVVVGEQGPEVFVPDQPGYVVPNHALGRQPVPNEFTMTSPAYAMSSGPGPGPGSGGIDVDSMVNEIRAMFGG